MGDRPVQVLHAGDLPSPGRHEMDGIATCRDEGVNAERDPLKYVLRLSGLEKMPKGYVVYYIKVSVESQLGALPNAQSRVWYIGKRFRKFVALHQKIVQANGTAPDLPPKQYFGSMEPAFLEQRKKRLSTFLWELASSPALCAIRCVREFLWSDVTVPPTRTLLPSTPLQGPRSTSVSAASISLDMSFSLDEATQVDLADADVNDAQGQLILTSCEELEQSFASEGIRFAQEDVIESEDDTDDGPLPAYLAKACTGFLPGIYQCYTKDATAKMRESSNAFDPQRSFEAKSAKEAYASLAQDEQGRRALMPKLRIVILLIGSRGDVQPYVALGRYLAKLGHFVRIAAHECFRSFVTSNELGFAPLAGDPKELLRMVTEHAMFSYRFVKEGVSTHRSWVSEVLEDAWDACTLPESRLRGSAEYNGGTREPRPPVKRSVGTGPGWAFAARKSSFRADFLIANPPSFAGWHISEALGIPLVMSFPMPWSRTTMFPSPFTNIKSSPSARLNWMSYGAVDRLIWLGTGDLVNRWRENTLRLQPIWTLSERGHRLIHDHKVPHLYPWSPNVLPRPKDWGSHICVPGYWFLDGPEQSTYRPDPALLDFLNSGSEPIFIGFGSIVVKDPQNLSKIVVGTIETLAKSHRFVVQAGWSNLDISAVSDSLSSRVFCLGPVPHKWLFERCKLVVHHGGAGTTAEAFRAGKPSVIVPFFGDQFFWAKQVKDVRVGAAVSGRLTVKTLSTAIESSLGRGTKMRAQVLGKSIQREKGLDVAVAFLERHFLNLEYIKPVPSLGQELVSSGETRNNSLEEAWRSAHGHALDEEWRKWPYTDLHLHKLKSAKTSKASVSRRFKAVGVALKDSIGQSSTSPLNPGVELQPLELHQDRTSDFNEQNLPRKQFSVIKSSRSCLGAEPLPPGHTEFSWTLKSVKAQGAPRPYLCGHTAFSLGKQNI